MVIMQKKKTIVVEFAWKWKMAQKTNVNNNFSVNQKYNSNKNLAG